MLGSEILEVTIGVLFIFTLVSIICTAIREGIEGWLKSRAVYLEFGIRELLHDKTAEGLAKSLYNHPLIHNLFLGEYTPGTSVGRPSCLARGAGLPSYIPSRNFALALMDIAARGSETDAASSDPSTPVISLDTIRTNIWNLNNQPVQRVMLTAIDSAQGDLAKAQALIEAWFDSSMDRISGWYKRSTQIILFWIGLVVAVGLNINTITVADYLYRNDSARTAIVTRAESAEGDSARPTGSDEAMKELNSLTLPIGWSNGWGAPRRGDERKGQETSSFWNNGIAPVLGWLLTALAATMGAPFWFDVLNKVMVIRSTVKPHEKSPEEASEDRQLAPRQKPEGPGDDSERTAGDAGRVQPGPVAPALSDEVPASTDAEDEIDGCDVRVTQATSDENLPAAEGGVI